MDIKELWLSQLNLRRLHQIPSMLEVLYEGGSLPPIILTRCDDGEIQVEDGHHRLTAIWLSGKMTLDYRDCIVVEKPQWKPRVGRIETLLQILERNRTIGIGTERKYGSITLQGSKHHAKE